MSAPFLGEVRGFAFGFVPKGWAACNGALLPINQNQALFAILGVNYGGDGRTTFALPDLRGRTPVHPGQDVGVVGQRGGEENHTLTSAEVPAESLLVDAPARTSNPGGALPARGGAYADNADGVSGVVGGGQPHENRAPYLPVTYAIAVSGIFPSRN